jgi:hypothetical protein
MTDDSLCIFGEVLFDHFPDGRRVLGGIARPTVALPLFEGIVSSVLPRRLRAASSF